MRPFLFASLCALSSFGLVVGCDSDDGGGSTGPAASGGASAAGGSSSGGSPAAGAAGVSAGGAGGGNSGACADASGAWKVTQHCEASLVGSPVTVMQQGCKLSFAPPFNGFSGTVGPGGEVALSGPQTCSGALGSGTLTMTCTPGACTVSLAR